MKLWTLWHGEAWRRLGRRILESRGVIFLGSVAVLGAVVLALLMSPVPQTSTDERVAPVRTVTVIKTSAATHAAQITGLAEVRPRWSSTLRALVDGVLLEVSTNLQPGTRVTSGQVLAIVDPTAWEANLAEAENRLELAGLNLLREQQEAVEARQSWDDSGLTGEPASRLVLREPQIAAAEAEVEAARAARDWAARQLESTKIRAPFSGIVAARHISRGETILPGEPVAEIFDTRVFELALQVSESQWRHLPVPVVGTTADLVEPGSSGRWHATVARVDGALDPTTRLRTLHLTVHDPLANEPPLLPGSFVTVHIDGRQIAETLELPESALTRSGHVWYVDGDDTLRRYATSPLFTRPGRIYIPEPESVPLVSAAKKSWRIVRYPLDSFMAGLSVRPVADGPSLPGGG